MIENNFMFEPFQYEPLPTPTSIRLVSLVKTSSHPGPSLGGRAPRLIEVALRTVDLADNPAYKALSYTWGDPFSSLYSPARVTATRSYYDLKHQWPVVINGKLGFVGRNLHDALSQFLALSQDYDINRPLGIYGKSRLVDAAEKGEVDEVRRLLERGADIHSRDKFRETALHYAAENGHLEVVKVLLSWGADRDLLDSTRRTPLACCRQRRRRQHEEVERVLLEPPGPAPQDKMNRVPSDCFTEDDLWIDSLSINQIDLGERNAQVALMARIFGSAVSVKIWLGPADAGTKQALSLFRKDADYKKPLREFYSAPQSRKGAAWRLLALRSWFKRKWVIQEFCLAKEYEMFCGDLEIEPIPFALHVKDGEIRRTDFDAGLTIKYSWDLMSLRAWYKPRFFQSGGTTAPSLDLAALIILTWKAESSDPRDSIFALLSLVMDTTAKGRTPLTADYTKPIADVFTEAGRMIMETGARVQEVYGETHIYKPLEALSFVQHQAHDSYTRSPGMIRRGDLDPHRRIGAPSWVPNFHQELPSLRISRPDFCASGSGTQSVIWPSDTTVLGVNGYRLDRISAREPKNVSQEPGSRGWQPLFKNWFSAVTQLSLSYPGYSDATPLTVLWRTLIADDESKLPSVSSGSRHHFRNFLRCYLWRGREHWRSDLDHLNVLATADDADLIPTAEEVEKSQAKEEDDRYYYQRLVGYYTNRMLFWTRHGRLGLGPGRAQKGDEVWLIAGTRTPFILRPLGNGGSSDSQAKRFEFLGECYVHGVMRGEAVDGKNVSFEPIQLE